MEWGTGRPTSRDDGPWKCGIKASSQSSLLHRLCAAALHHRLLLVAYMTKPAIYQSKTAIISSPDQQLAWLDLPSHAPTFISGCPGAPQNKLAAILAPPRELYH